MTTEQKLRAQLAAATRWADATDEQRRNATETARRARVEQFERQIDPDGTLDPQERARRLAQARRAHSIRMNLARRRTRR